MILSYAEGSARSGVNMVADEVDIGVKRKAKLAAVLGQSTAPGVKADDDGGAVSPMEPEVDQAVKGIPSQLVDAVGGTGT